MTELSPISPKQIVDSDTDFVARNRKPVYREDQQNIWKEQLEFCTIPVWLTLFTLDLKHIFSIVIF